MKINKIEIVLLISCFLVGIVFLIVIFTSFNATSHTQINSLPTITITPSTTERAFVSSPIKYDLNAQKKLIENINNKNAIATKDAQVKETIITSLLSGQTGIVYASTNINISYIKSADIFQGEILTTNIALAKQETVNWFMNHGVSQQGICKLPLMFFLNQDVSSQIQDANIVFSPLPPGC